MKIGGASPQELLVDVCTQQAILKTPFLLVASGFDCRMPNVRGVIQQLLYEITNLFRGEEGRQPGQSANK